MGETLAAVETWTDKTVLATDGGGAVTLLV